MDTCRQAVTEKSAVASPAETPPARQRRSVEEKRRIVEETLVEGASVARVARGHGINANQVFGWRRLYQAGRLGGTGEAIQMLPVRVSESSPSRERSREGSCAADFPAPRLGTIHIELGHAQVRIEGSADAVLVRVLMECLRA